VECSVLIARIVLGLLTVACIRLLHLNLGCRIPALSMNPKRRSFEQSRASRVANRPNPEGNLGWLGERFRYVAVIGVVLITLCTVIIYWQTVRVPPIDYEDPVYLVHSPYVHVNSAFSRLGAVWNEPYFANFHPVTTTTWLIDRMLADGSKAFDAVPFRLTQLVYAAIGASLLMVLYRRLGIPAILAALGAVLYAVHPIHTEVVAWLSARKDLVSLVFIVGSVLAWLWALGAATPNQWRLRHALTILLSLLAVLSKPVAVIIPALFVAYEFCSRPHVGIISWRWAQRHDFLLVTRTIAMTVTFLVIGGASTVVFRILLAKDQMHGGWLIFLPIGLLLLMATMAPSTPELGRFRESRIVGIRVVSPPLIVLSVVSGAGSAWTFWAQQQAGAIKGGLTLLPTLNLTFDATLAYVGKTLVPAHMSASYTWSAYPYVSVRGLLGAGLAFATVWTGMRLAGSPDCNRRLIAFGIFWYLIALIPVSNLVPTSTKMADRYLFVPTVGAILVLCALATIVCKLRRSQIALCAGFMLVITLYTAWSYSRTRVWCGETTLWNNRPQPDLSLWVSAVETNPDDIYALISLALAYLRLNPPEADEALIHLNRALQLSEANQEKIAGDKQLILTLVYAALGDGYLAKASQLSADRFATGPWQQKNEAYISAAKYFELASQVPSGFAPSDARVLGRLAEAYEGEAQMDTQEIAMVPPVDRDVLIRERDGLRSKSEESIRRAREILIAGNVYTGDPDYRIVMIEMGNMIFGREVGASKEERSGYYRRALLQYQDAAALFPDDPRPFLYQGLCYERLTDIAQSLEEKRQQFVLGEAALRKALTLKSDSPGYSPALPYRALASLYSHVNDFHSALDSLENARQVDPAGAESKSLSREIQSIEQYLAAQQKDH
jgi:tetratricopeptide (TPR) repeat protein